MYHKLILILLMATCTISITSYSKDGLTGPQGEQGAKGNKGDKGSTGSTGATGTANVIYSNWIQLGFSANTSRIVAPHTGHYSQRRNKCLC